MAIRKTVKRGDSLWGLSCRYLGSGTRYRKILEYHNKEAARFGLMPIEDEDLIFVGQTVLIPPREKQQEEGDGTKAQGGKLAIPLDLKVTYAIGRDTPPVLYVTSYADYTIKTEMSGDISIEIASTDRYRHSLELFFSKDPLQAKQKLHGAYDPAVAALIAKPEMVFESGRVKIKAPIAAKAKIGLYNFEVQTLSPMHMSGSFKPSPISGTFELNGSKYKYSADIELKTEVHWHPKPNAGPESVRAKAPASELNQTVADNPPGRTKWDHLVDEKGVTVAVFIVLGTAAARFMTRLMTRGCPLYMPSGAPFYHTIDERDLRA